MKSRTRPFLILLLLTVAANSVSSQSVSYPSCSDCYSLPVVVKIPKPKYPLIAVRRRITGSVIVRVRINERGKVTEAIVMKGPEELRKVSVGSALTATFQPAISISEPRRPTRSVGQITYSFILEESEAEVSDPIPGSISMVECRGCEDRILLPIKIIYPQYVAYGPHKFEGLMGIDVTINPDGNVKTAKAIYGHPHFRPMFEKQVLKAVFRPADGPTRGTLVFKVTPAG